MGTSPLTSQALFFAPGLRIMWKMTGCTYIYIYTYIIYIYLYWVYTRGCWDRGPHPGRTEEAACKCLQNMTGVHQALTWWGINRNNASIIRPTHPSYVGDCLLGGRGSRSLPRQKTANDVHENQHAMRVISNRFN